MSYRHQELANGQWREYSFSIIQRIANGKNIFIILPI